MKCQDANLVAVMDGLAGYEADEEHVKQCPKCAEKLARIQRLIGTIVDLKSMDISMELDDKLMKIDMSTMAELPPRIKAELAKLKK